MDSDEPEPSRSSDNPVAAHSQQNFSLGDISLPLSLTTSQHISLSSVPRVELPQNAPPRRPARPSSASDDRIVRLPTVVSDVEGSRSEHIASRRESGTSEDLRLAGSINEPEPANEGTLQRPGGLLEGEY